MNNIKFLFVAFIYFVTYNCSYAIAQSPDLSTSSKPIYAQISPKNIHHLSNNTICMKAENLCYQVSTDGISKIDVTTRAYNMIDNHYFSTNGVKPLSITGKTSQFLYIGTDKGVYIATQQPSGDYQFKYINGFGSNEITTIRIDAKQNIFVGTRGNGLWVGTKKSDGTYDVVKDDFLPSYSIQSIMINKGGEIFVAANSKNDSDKSSVVWLKNSNVYLTLPEDMLINGVSYSNGMLEIGTDHGLLVATQDSKGTFTTSPAIQHIVINNINANFATYISPSGDIYVQTQQSLQKVEKKYGHYVINNNPSSQGIIPFNLNMQRATVLSPQQLYFTVPNNDGPSPWQTAGAIFFMSIGFCLCWIT